ncbi:cupredoxin domain-containing protein [Candidatus Pacearchaeota archaeon]|nr:MAG: hypothetical protein QJ16_C0006G0004 [archaeon GW2011_AR1]MBS3078003.1 cupredoxin domain-containing protein [Candidatus Pacearchaeota archaeon]HIH52208.1 hypothetical protein [Nanoarchaeota archaeon]
MNNKLMLFTLIILIIAGGWFFIGSSWTVNANVSNDGSTENVQKVTLSMKNYNYYPNTVTVKVGQPVRIYLDSSVSGCYRSFTIRDFGIAKYLQNPTDYVEFTPNKKGSFRFACSMGMGTGTLVVE